MPVRIKKFILIFVVIFGIIAFSDAYAAEYYVATSGNDGNSGLSISSAFRNIQKCLDVVQPGDSCNVGGGTYHEALYLRQSGNATGKITVKNYNGETAVINSGNNRALRVETRRVHYYVIDGLRFVSNYQTYDSWGTDYTLDFKDLVWDGDNPDGGSSNNVIRNCYVEGAIMIYGHGNIVENCEINGKWIWKDGIMDRNGVSHDNIYRKNKIHGYIERGVWTMENTSDTTITENTIYDVGLAGVDCDGAGRPVYRCSVTKNLIYNADGRGIEFENAFNGLAEKNIIHDTRQYGIHFINYGYGPDWNSNAEYRTTNTNGVIRNNVVYNTDRVGIQFTASPGNKVYNNTVFGNKGTENYYGGISFTEYGGYNSNNNEIRNNIFSQNNPQAVWIAPGTSGLVFSNNAYFHDSKSGTHLITNHGNDRLYSLSEYRGMSGQEFSSIFSNPNFTNISANDFTLQSNSSAINAGMTLNGFNDDFKGIQRSQGSAWDIGAYEFSSGGSGENPPPPSDPPNKTYSIADVIELIEHWLQQANESSADVYMDDFIDIRDLGIMMSKWQ